VNLAGLEVDAYWADVDVAIEVDGAQVHHTRRAFHRDRARDRRLASRGTRVVRVTWWDLSDEGVARRRATRDQGRRWARSR
jgi:very-short-patch-repair endonuclease